MSHLSLLTRQHLSDGSISQVAGVPQSHTSMEDRAGTEQVGQGALRGASRTEALVLGVSRDPTPAVRELPG